jgi:poly(A) polymerase
MTVLETIYTAGFSAYLHGFGAIDSWLGESETFVHILTNAGTADLARLFEDLRYPGIDLADAALDRHGDKNETWYFRCADSFNDNRPSFNLLEFYQDCKTRVFYDPSGIYPLLAGIRDGIRKPQKINIETALSPPEIFRQGINLGFDRTRSSMDAALILAKYFHPDLRAEKYIDEISRLFASPRESSPVKQEEQRILLCSLLSSANPGLGFELLKKSGFISEYWPELAILDKADHSKEFHPEGNAWEHTMETFRHRKAAFHGKASVNKKAHNRKTCAFDIRLSLGLLLHDAGKPIAVSDGRRRFDGHAELGEIQARRFLERLGFDASTIHDVCFLVRNHMLPAALPRLPLYRTERIMSSPLFPLLLELYRCDEASSFKGLDGYYESSAAYQSFLRNRRNPYRSDDGKKLNNKQINKTAKFYSQR